MATLCIHYFISGTVQGVWFRASAQEKAVELHLTGWVKNTYDGRVECTVSGKEENIASFEKWLKIGPPSAKVEHIEKTPQELRHFVEFEILR